MAEQKGDKFIPNQHTFGTMDTAFGTIPGELVVREPREVLVPVVITDTVSDQERKNDVAVTRETLHRVLSKSEDALDDLLILAKSSQAPRTYEVVGQLIKTLSDVATQLVDLHKKSKELDGKLGGDKREEKLTGQTNVENQTNNIVFTGSATDLLDILNQNKNREISIN